MQSPPESTFAPAQPLDALDRITIAYLTLPLVIFLAGWFEWWAALPLIACTAYAVRPLLGALPITERRLRVTALQLAVAIVAGCGWTLLGGADHIAFANADWHIRDAVLHDLVASPWPVGYGLFDGKESILRAPVAFYLPAALVGKVFGLAAAHVAMGCWTALGATLFLMQVLSLTPSRWGTGLLVAAVVILFSGLDIVGSLLNDGPRFRSDWNITTHLEWWAGKFQYSSMTTQLFWVPNHALAGWLTIGLLLRHPRSTQLNLLLPIIVVTAALWSPLTALGLVPFVLWRVAADSWRERSWRLVNPLVWAPAATIGLVISAYLVLDPGRVAKGVAVSSHGDLVMDLLQQAQFFLLEAGLIGAALLVLQRSSQVALALVILALLPLVYLGPANDLVMRASIPSLTILTIASCLALIEPAADKKRFRYKGVLAGLLLIGAVTPVEEIARAVLLPSWPLNKTATLFGAACGHFSPHYVARLGDEEIGHLMRPTHRIPLEPQGPGSCRNPAFELMWSWSWSPRPPAPRRYFPVRPIPEIPEVIVSHTESPAPITEIEMPVLAGQVIYANVGRSGQPLVVLSPPDADGFLRFAPLVTSGSLQQGAGVALEAADFTSGGVAGWLRLDRVSWQYINCPEVVGVLKPAALARLHRALCTQEARAYSDIAHRSTAFVPGKTPIPPSGKVIGARELELLVESSLDGWLTTGRFNDAFERKLGQYLGRKYARTTNSGSSANLLAMTALTSSLLGDRALRPGDEVITVAAGFPTTVNPTLQNGLVPVFVDVTLPTYNIDPERIEGAVSSRTRAIMIAHTLGNPFDLDAVMDVARRHNLWVIEDCCDALGATYRGRKVGTFGHIGTLSFYPAHHITMGEGGAVFTDDDLLRRAVESIRDWGRDCYCAPGRDNTCGKRFKWQLGDMPAGYDHKYTYSHLGYNLKITDMQAAVGLAQMDRLEGFIESRKQNFAYLRSRLAPLSDLLMLPEATPGSDPSWFGFPMTLLPNVTQTREQVTNFLERHKIGTRLLFAGNLTRQPYFRGRPHRVSGTLENTDLVMARTFWIGLYPALTSTMLDYSADKLIEFLKR